MARDLSLISAAAYDYLQSSGINFDGLKILTLSAIFTCQTAISKKNFVVSHALNFAPEEGKIE